MGVCLIVRFGGGWLEKTSIAVNRACKILRPLTRDYFCATRSVLHSLGHSPYPLGHGSEPSPHVHAFTSRMQLQFTCMSSWGTRGHTCDYRCGVAIPVVWGQQRHFAVLVEGGSLCHTASTYEDGTTGIVPRKEGTKNVEERERERVITTNPCRRYRPSHPTRHQSNCVAIAAMTPRALMGRDVGR